MSSVDLGDLGWEPGWDAAFRPLREAGLEPARVVTEDRGIYQIVTADGQLDAHVPGRLLHRIRNASELPKVGDWVGVRCVEGEDKALIEGMVQRRTHLARRVAGREVKEQVLVANVNLALIMHSLDKPVNQRLLERQLVMVQKGGIQPVVVLNKSDLCDSIDQTCDALRAAFGDLLILHCTAFKRRSLKEIRALIAPGKTVVLLGVSGVGKSTLVNSLMGEEVQHTIEVRESDSKGRHTTTARDMFLLKGGGLIIDTPGMRELQLWSSSEEVTQAFDDIESLAVQCHFRACTHTRESRCAVRGAVEQGSLSAARLASFHKLSAEAAKLEKDSMRRRYVEQKRQTRVAARALENPKHRTAWLYQD